MKLSTQVKYVKLNSGNYAIFNNLLMDIVYVNEIEKNKILNMQVTDNLEIEYLQEKGIYVKDEFVDNYALKKKHDQYSDVMLGKMHIMYLILTNECNLRCTYCFLENNKDYKCNRTDMSEDILTIAVEKYCRYIVDNNILDPLIVMYGGEPVLKFDLIKQVVELATKYLKNIKFTLITNGTLITKDIADYLKNNNVNIGISIDGTEKIHNLNRPFKNSKQGSFKSVNNVRKMLKENENEYGLSMTVTRDFIDNKKEILKWLENENEKSVFYNMYHYSSSADDWEKTAEDTVDFLIESYERFIQDDMTDGRIQRQINSIVNNEFVFSDCGAVGCGQYVVMPNGDITICHGDSNTGKHILGNIKDIEIESIANTLEGRKWINKPTIFVEECVNCEAFFCCGGGCRLQAENLFGSRDAIDKFHCIYAKKILKWILEKCE